MDGHFSPIEQVEGRGAIGAFSLTATLTLLAPQCRLLINDQGA
jgi:hypothetical protein